MSQCEKILDYMREHGSITQIEAADRDNEIYCWRLSGRIKDLRNRGYCIITDWETSRNSHGETKRYGRYRLGGKDAPKSNQENNSNNVFTADHQRILPGE